MSVEFDTAIVGLGATGYACLQFLMQRNLPVVVTDTRVNPPFLNQARQTYPSVPIYCGEFAIDPILKAKQVMISQGIANADPKIQEILKFAPRVISDTELFVQHTKQPIIAITGTNGKSTVTSLLGTMAKTCGVTVGVGGNLGPPALDLIVEPEPAYYILEVSNFQLEATHSLAARVACILNLSPDHLDRYSSYQAYIDAKQRIYKNCHTAVINRQDQATWPALDNAGKIVSFGTDQPEVGMFGIVQHDGQNYLAHGKERLISTAELALVGHLNWQNSLAALAIGHSMGLSMATMLDVLKTYQGLNYRCQKIATIAGVTYINDSKGTNIGATIAALESIGRSISGKIVWLAGGEGKGADFSLLTESVAQFVRHAILFGRDAHLIASQLPTKTPRLMVAHLQQALNEAQKIASAGDVVLLSPACASFDMFKDFNERGAIFTNLVRGLS